VGSHIGRLLTCNILRVGGDGSITPSFLNTMVDYLKGVLGDFPEDITGSVPTPASEHLFDVRPDEEKTMLNEEQV
jgi:hypothetical protein